MNDSPFPTMLVIVCIFLFIILSFGVYSDYQYKMKKLDLIEKGILKSCVELVDKEK